MTERKLRKRLLTVLPIETERLILRRIELADAYDMYEYASLPEVCEYLLWSPHINLGATEGYIEFLQERYKKGLYGDWAVELKENGKMIGTCGFADINSKDLTFEIGYVLSPEYRKCGYMTEAARAVLDSAFTALGLQKATVRIIKENTASVAVAERLGFRLCGETVLDIKDRLRDVLIFELEASEFK